MYKTINIMKKLLLMILIISSSYAQENRRLYIATGIDFRNAIVGSDPTMNKSSYDGIIKFGYGNETWDMASSIEIFPMIGYYSLSFQPSYVLIDDSKNRVSAGVEISMIQRKNIQEKSYIGEPVFIGTGLNVDYRRTITHVIDLGLHWNVKTRPDIKEIYEHDSVQTRSSIYVIVFFNILRPD